jgi:hypothetical protein
VIVNVNFMMYCLLTTIVAFEAFEFVIEIPVIGLGDSPLT